MGLFDKKYCDICGEKIGLLGNKKLEDGNICKNCAGKLSPWFSERKHSSLDQIKEQLAYREANKAQVAAFHCTRTLGKNTKVLLDEDACRFMVAQTSNIANENPDVLSYSDVTGCELVIDETRHEIKRKDKDGKEVSFVPPRYEYEYNFKSVIRVNNPYFDEISFRLNPSSINERNRGEYDTYKAMGDEIKQALSSARQQARDSAAAASAPKIAVTCPWCGATTMATASGCCEYCGGALNG